MDRSGHKRSNKVEVMVTPIPSNDASVRNTGQEERNEELEKENEHLKIRILETEEVAQRVRNGLTGKYSGKNKICKKDAMTTKDQLNCTQT